MAFADLVQSLRTDGLVSTNAGDIAWLSGFAVPHESWPSPLHVLTAVVAGNDGGVTLVVPDALADLGEARTDVVVERYPTYGLSERLRLQGQLAIAVAAAVRGRGLKDASITVDAALPLAVARALEPSRLTAIEDPTMEARMQKTDAEIELIRDNARTCDLFQRGVREQVAPGVTEAEVFAAARRLVEAEAGKRVTILGDLVSGERTLAGGGPPGERRLARGDAVLCDVAISVNGYWADNCSTVSAGPPSEVLVRTARVVHEALQLAIDRCRRGVRAGAVDSAVREFLKARGYGFGHHLGHGVGAGYHELPRLVPGADQRLDESMVLCLEPAALTGTPVGVRHEVVGVVRADGFECLSALPELP